MKIIAFYLPQFHEIPENNAWWGDGFTEWVNVKSAKPLFPGHNQPRVPLNGNYYNLLDDSVKQWQVDLANQYGVYGFCFYHYWFGGKLLLEKPVEQFLRNKSLNIHYCICWANEHWTNAWSGKNTKVLIEQHYGTEKEWEEHFNYLLPFFQDSRYIQKDGKPLLVIYRPELIPCLNKMLDFWEEKAREHGFAGIDFAYQHAGFTVAANRDESRFTYALEYHPNCAQVFRDVESFAGLKHIKKAFITYVENSMGINLREVLKKKRLKHFSYDEIWDYILKMTPRNEKCVPGAFVDWDNTPRKGARGMVADGASPDKFEKYLTEQIQRAREIYKKDMLFVFSWNEWAEGGYLEPDEKNGYAYLEAVKAALIARGELEEC